MELIKILLIMCVLLAIQLAQLAQELGLLCVSLALFLAIIRQQQSNV